VANPTVDLGTFLAFLLVPVVTLIFMGKIRSWGVGGYILFLGMGTLSFIMLGGLALMMYVPYDVVIIENVLQADALGNTTGTETHTTPIIANFQDIWATVFGGFGFIFGVLFFWVLVKGGP